MGPRIPPSRVPPPTPPSEPRPSVPRLLDPFPWELTAPLLAVFAVLGVLGAWSVARLLFAPYPLDPWEAGMLVEGWRSGHGMPLYGPAARHATQFYGPLYPVLAALAERVGGVSFASLRALTVLSTGLLVTIAVTLAARANPRMRWLAVAGVGPLVAVNQESTEYLVRGRPDMVALLLALAGVLAIARAEAEDGEGAAAESRAGLARQRTTGRRPGARARRLVWPLLGVALLLAATFVKLPMAAASGIPFVAAALRHPVRGRPLLAALAYPALVLLALVILRAAAPDVYHAMVVVPARYDLRLGVGLVLLGGRLAGLPLLWVALFLRTAPGTGTLSLPRDERWVLAATLLAAVVGTLQIAKAGGTENAWLPLLVTSTLFSLLVLVRELPALSRRLPHAARRVMVGAVLALVTFFSFPRAYHVLFRLERLSGHDEVVRLLRARGATPVSSPLDNSVTLLARGKPTRSLVQELDAHPERGQWMSRVPAGIRAELDSARVAVLVERWYRTPLTADSLLAYGFVRGGIAGHYSVWVRRDRR